MKNIQSLDQLDKTITESIKQNFYEGNLLIQLEDLYKIARKCKETNLISDYVILMYVLGKVQNTIPSHKWNKRQIRNTLEQVQDGLKITNPVFKRFIK